MGWSPAEVVAALERGELAARCATEACRATLAALAGPGWVVGTTGPAGPDRIVRADHRDARGLSPVWLRVGPDDRVLAVAGLRGDPYAELGVTALPVDPWTTGLRCRAGGSGACTSLLDQARRAGGALRPLGSWSEGERRLAVVDFLVDGRVADRVWVYASGDAARAEVVGVDEDEAHGPPWLAGELPGDGTAPVPADASLWGAAEAWCAGRVPAALADRALGSCRVEAAGAIGRWGAACLVLPSGDHLTVRVTDGVPAFGGYGLDCALTVGDLY